MKRRYGVWLCILLAVLAVLTYTSTQVYKRNLPVVTTAWPVNTSLRYQWQLEGTVVHKEPLNYTLPVIVEVVKFMAEPGQWIEKEQALLQVDTEGLYDAWLSCKMEEAELERQLSIVEGQLSAAEKEALQSGEVEEVQSEGEVKATQAEGKVTAGSDMGQMQMEGSTRSAAFYQYELLSRQLTALQEKIVRIEQIQEQNGFIYATEAGIILNCAGQGKFGTFAAETALMTQGTAEGTKEITFLLDEKQASYCNGDVKLAVDLVQRNAEAEKAASAVIKESTALTVSRTYYNAEKKQYQCVVATNLPLAMMNGEATTAQMDATSASYNCVIPTSAIVSQNNGNASFYVLREKEGILGKTDCVQLDSLYILEQNEFYTALAQQVTEPVVASWNKALEAGMAVRVE